MNQHQELSKKNLSFAHLFSEMLNSQDADSRVNAALLFGSRRYKRGFKHIRSAVQKMLKEEAGLVNSSIKLKYFGALLYALGRMNTAASHDFLQELLSLSCEPAIRAEILESMAYEKDFFNESLVLPFTNLKCHDAEILSALYALESHSYALNNYQKALEIARKLFDRGPEEVKVYAIQLLRVNRECLEFCQNIGEPLEAEVRNAVDEVAYMWKEF